MKKEKLTLKTLKNLDPVKSIEDIRKFVEYYYDITNHPSEISDRIIIVDFKNAEYLHYYGSLRDQDNNTFLIPNNKKKISEYLGTLPRIQACICSIEVPNIYVNFDSEKFDNLFNLIKCGEVRLPITTKFSRFKEIPHVSDRGLTSIDLYDSNDVVLKNDSLVITEFETKYVDQKGDDY